MAFFDDLGKKLSQAGQSVAQKTKDFSEVNKLNGTISAEEKKINNTYLQLGREYYLKHAEDSEACFEQLVLAIKESEQKIEMLHQQIMEIKKVARCEKCGAEIANNASFCSSCGAAAAVKTPVAAEDSAVCSACGQTVKAGTKFCTYCGASMTTSAPAQPVASVSQEMAAEETENAPSECEAE